MHFYMRNAKAEDIDAFKKDKKLKMIGMPEFIASGSQEIQSLKHRFLVLPRFGQDIWKIFTESNNSFPLHTAFRIGWQILNVLEYIHGREYVHADIKGSNILLGFGKGGHDQVYLLDYGLACRFDASKDFKPDPKKMHNGTIEYTSRDAHQGVPTLRGDIEILAYNMIEWTGGKLPWVTAKLLNKPAEVQKSKESFMSSIDSSLKTAFSDSSVPKKMAEFFKLIITMKPQAKPDYSKIRTIFETAIKEYGSKNTGPLDFKPAAATKTTSKAKVGKPDFTSHFGETYSKADEAGPSKKPAPKRTKKVAKSLEQNVEEIEISPKVKPTAKKSPAKKLKESIDETKVPKRTRAVRKPAIVESDSDIEKPIEKTKSSPQKKPRNEELKTTAFNKDNHTSRKKPIVESESDVEEEVQEKQRSPQKKPRKEESKSTASSKENHISPETIDSKKDSHNSIKIKSKTPSKNRKVIKLNLNLDLSLNSDLVVVVNRKDKKSSKRERDESSATPADKKDTPNRAGVYKGKKAK